MQAYVLIKIDKSEDFHSCYDKISKIREVVKSDRLLGSWDCIAKIEGNEMGEISGTVDKIISCGNIRDTLTLIIYPQ